MKSSSKAQPKQPDVITQRDLRAVLALYTGLLKAAESLRKRVVAGATVKSGRLGVRAGTEPVYLPCDRDFLCYMDRLTIAESGHSLLKPPKPRRVA
jgi:hypothetical protein